MEEKLEDFRELWEDASGRYVLIQVMTGSTDPTTCVVYDMHTRAGLLIEDDDLAIRVKTRMAASGVSMLREMPK
jgi:uncharacterized ParB-like nuclease family protein